MNLVGKYIIASLVDTDFGKQFDIILSADIIADFKKLLDNAKGRAFKADIPIYNFLRKMNYPVNSDSSISLRKEYSGYDINSENLCYPNCVTGIMSNFKQYYDLMNGRAFQIDFPIYSLLKKLNFATNPDKSITLQGEYSGYSVNSDNVCYPNKIRENTLTFENINIIFDSFFRNKTVYSNHDSRGDITYGLSSYAIYEIYDTYKVGHMRDRRTGTSTSIALAVGDDLADEHIQFLAGR